ncbi:MAG: YcxB family protein [Lentisphaeraceae bacterium]|nr:YcxB family protein [Lentisphaeraceae bacterium]
MIDISYQISTKEHYKIALVKFFMRRETRLVFFMGIFSCLASSMIEEGFTILLIGGMAALTPLTHIYWTRRILNSAPHILEPINIQFSEKTIKVISSNGSSDFNWELINKTQESSKYFFLYLNELNALVVPKRNFTSDQLMKFKTMLESLKS